MQKEGYYNVQATKPKKAMSSYLYFVQNKKEFISVSLQTRTRKEVFMELAEMWKSLPPDEKQHYVELSAADQERQRSQKQAFQQYCQVNGVPPQALKKQRRSHLGFGSQLNGQPMGPRKGRPPKLPSFTPAYTQQPSFSAFSYSQQPAVSSSADVADICKSVLQLQQNCVQQLNQQQACLQQVVAFLHNFTHTAALPNDTAPQDEAFNYPDDQLEEELIEEANRYLPPHEIASFSDVKTELPYYEAYNTFETSFIKQCQKTTPGLSATQMQDYARAEWDKFPPEKKQIY